MTKCYFLKSYEAHNFYVSTGYRTFSFNENHSCKVFMVFQTKNGFDLLVNRLKIENLSKYSIIFRQPQINPEEEDTLLKKLLTKLDFEGESQNLFYEYINGECKHIIKLNGEVCVEDIINN